MPWPYVDPMVIALPLSFIITIVVSLLTQNSKKEQEDIDALFEGKTEGGDIND